MSRIVCFVCLRSGKDALELAEARGWKRPQGLEVVEMPCSGRVETIQMLRAFTNGAEAVMVVGCLEGNCQYHSGNYEARKRAERVRSILHSIGIDEDRIGIFNVSSNQAWKFPEIIEEMESKTKRKEEEG